MRKEWIARRRDRERIRSRVKRRARTYVVGMRLVVVVHDLNVRMRRLLHALLSHEFVQTSPPKITRCGGPAKDEFNRDNYNYCNISES